MNKVFSLYDFLIYIFLPFGQLLARINLLNNSIDKSWLILFCFIPFILIPILPKLLDIKLDIIYFFVLIVISNVIPLLLIENGKINLPEKKIETSIDKFVLLPIIIKFIIVFFFLTNGINETQIDNTNFIEANLKSIIIFISIFYSLWVRKNHKCNLSNSNKFMTILLDTIFIYTMSDLSVDIFNNIKSNTENFPNIDESNNLLNLIFSIFGLFFSHTFINYFNDNDINNYCADNFYFNNIHVFTIMISIFYYYIKDIINVC
jgi:heme/copper-type cytochrome/quinol oxidase subunit 4